MLLPSDYIDIKFGTVSSSEGKKISYFINARGFLYEWMKENTICCGLEPAKFINGNKINNLKKILKYKELFLPQIYGEWIKEKSKNIFTA